MIKRVIKVLISVIIISIGMIANYYFIAEKGFHLKLICAIFGFLITVPSAIFWNKLLGKFLNETI